MLAARWRSAGSAESAGGPVHVLAAGQALAAGTDSGHTLLTLPAGGRGEPLGGRAAAALAGRLGCWVRIAAVCDGLLAGQAQPGDRAGAIGPNLDDGLLATWPGPFGWLLLAEPVSRTGLEELIQATSFALGIEQKYDNPKAQLRARRLSMRYTELRQSAAAGLWHVHLLAGAATPQAAAQVAGLVCTSADLQGLPYALQPLPGCASAPEVLAAPGTGQRGGPGRTRPGGAVLWLLGPAGRAGPASGAGGTRGAFRAAPRVRRDARILPSPGPRAGG